MPYKLKSKEKAYRKKHKKAISLRDRAYYRKNKKRIYARSRAWVKANRERVLVRHRRWRKKNLKRQRLWEARYRQKNRKQMCANHSKWYYKNQDRAKRARLKYSYGITLERFFELQKKQKNKCAICQEQFDKTPHVDHCHATRTIRGLLCGHCNRGLGMFKDSRKLLRNADAYLKQRGPKKVESKNERT